MIVGETREKGPAVLEGGRASTSTSAVWFQRLSYGQQKADDRQFYDFCDIYLFVVRIYKDPVGSSPLTSLSSFPTNLNLVTLVPKPGTRKPARHYATGQANANCGASQVARWSSSSSSPSADGHEAGASLPTLGPGAG